MARINSDLLQAISDKLGATTTRPAYTRIEQAVHDTFLERDLAALVVASKLKININKYSTAQQRAAIRSHLGGGGAGPAKPPATQSVTLTPAARSRSGKAAKPRKKDNSVFVISGRDVAVTESMYQLLDALNCKPVEFHQAVAKMRTGNPFIGDVLDKAFEQVQGLVVLFTPDDEAKLKDQFLKTHGDAGEKKLRGQPRPNVIFEAGMVMARHPEKTIMVQVGDMKPFSDISGRHLVKLDDNYDSRLDFATRLGRICKVDTTGTRWPKVGKFEPTGPAIGKAARKKKRR